MPHRVASSEPPTASWSLKSAVAVVVHVGAVVDPEEADESADELLVETDETL